MIPKILIIDDEKDFCWFVKKNLELEGEYSVSTAYSGEEALTLVCRAKPDVIILDLLMPKMDGRTIFAELKKDPSTASIPVILLTALDMFEAKRLVPGLSQEAYLTKPVKFAVLKDAINKVMKTR